MMFEAGDVVACFDDTVSAGSVFCAGDTGGCIVGEWVVSGCVGVVWVGVVVAFGVVCVRVVHYCGVDCLCGGSGGLRRGGAC